MYPEILHVILDAGLLVWNAIATLLFSMLGVLFTNCIAKYSVTKLYDLADLMFSPSTYPV